MSEEAKKHGRKRERWVLLKIPRCDIDGVGEVKESILNTCLRERKVGFTKNTAMRHRRVGGRAVTVTAMQHRQRYRVIEKGKD